jgi:hypothetical protein
MANALYDKGREHILEGAIAWLADDIRVVSIDEADDVPDLANDDFLDDIASGAREFASPSLSSKTSANGVADAADLLPAFTSAAGDQFESISLYVHTGVDSTSELICNIDTATGLPLTPDGGNINITWSNTADRIFKL